MAKVFLPLVWDLYSVESAFLNSSLIEFPCAGKSDMPILHVTEISRSSILSGSLEILRNISCAIDFDDSPLWSLLTSSN